MPLSEDSKAKQRPVRDKSRERGKKRAAVVLPVSISQSNTQSCIAGERGLSPVWHSLCQGRIGRHQAEHFTLASSHWGLTSFLPVSPECTRVGVLFKGLAPPLPCWLYCSALWCSKRNAELLSEALTPDSAAWAIIPSSHAHCEILSKSLYALLWLYAFIFSAQKLAKKQAYLTSVTTAALQNAQHQAGHVQNSPKATVCSSDQPSNNTPADYLCLFLGRSLNSSRWSLHYVTVILLQVRFLKVLLLCDVRSRARGEITLNGRWEYTGV